MFGKSVKSKAPWYLGRELYRGKQRNNFFDKNAHFFFYPHGEYG